MVSRGVKLIVNDRDQQRVEKLGAFKQGDDWMFSNLSHLMLMKRWLPGNLLISNFFQLISAPFECYSCHQLTHVKGSLLDSYNMADLDYGDDMEYQDLANRIGNFAVIPISEFEPFIPKSLKRQFKETWSIDYRYSHMRDATLLSNICSHCGKLQGDNYVMGRVGKGSPFTKELISSVWQFELLNPQVLWFNMRSGFMNDHIEFDCPKYHIAAKNWGGELLIKPNQALADVQSLPEVVVSAVQYHDFPL